MKKKFNIDQFTHISHLLLALLVIVVIGMGIWMLSVVENGKRAPRMTEQQVKEQMIGRIQPATNIDEEAKASMIDSIQSN